MNKKNYKNNNNDSNKNNFISDKTLKMITKKCLLRKILKNKNKFKKWKIKLNNQNKNSYKK